MADTVGLTLGAVSQHDSRVFVLGAGCSSFSGHPLMAGFAQAILELTSDRSTPLDDSERERFRNVLNYRSSMRRLYAYLRMDLDNIEHLFSLIDMSASLANSKNAADLRSDLVFVLVKTLELTRKHEIDWLKKVRPYMIGKDLQTVRKLRKEDTWLRPHLEFVTRLRPHDAVITFNYDTLLEDALLASSIGPDYGFENSVFNPTESVRTLLKLHGSVNFISHEDAPIQVVSHELTETPTSLYYERGDPLLVPPSWNKQPIAGIMGQIWARAQDVLAKATRLIFVGYSLPDNDLSFRYLLANALAENDELRTIVVVDPTEQTLARYQSFVAPMLLDQARFRKFQLTFENSIGAIFG